MKNHLIKLAAVAALAGGMAVAQTSPAPAPQPGQAKAGMRSWGMARQRMMQALNLTDAQKQQAKAIFQQARQSAQPVRQQLQQNRQALSAAVKANDAAQIQSLSNQQGQLEGQLLAIRSEARAKFYSSLTPDQKAKADQMQQRMRERMQERIQQRRANQNG
jgi:Spy/CpxP family protein refolding chaperone